MVYRGKISKSCFQCRKRKLRCDLRQDSCGACLRAKLPCTGYRDTQQLQIRDESALTERKALIRRSKTIPQTPTVSTDELARNAFFFRYVSGFSSSYDVLEPLYKNAPSGGHLVASVDAVGLAFLTFQSGFSQASHLARTKYLHALSLLKNALVSSSSVRSDSTLLTVLLLDLFEKITANNPCSTDAWMSHVNGALALVKLRDKKQFEGYTGLRLSIRLSTNLIISCIAANAQVPSTVIKLRSDIETFINKSDPKWRISGLTIKFANLRGVIQEGHLSASDIIIRSKALEEEFMSLARMMPPAWTYSTVYLEEASERVLEQHYELYKDHLVTQAWNVFRVMRIFLNDIIRIFDSTTVDTMCETGAKASTSNVSDNTIDILAREICATAPQYTTCADASSKRMENFAIESLRCYTLIFPLYVAGLYASPATKVRPWVVKELRFMASEFGIRNANVIADILERGDGADPWSVYTIIGSYAFAA